jgi:hypothetical protein
MSPTKATMTPNISRNNSVGSTKSQTPSTAPQYDAENSLESDEQCTSKPHDRPARSWSTSTSSSTHATIEPPILVYHESARSIVFRDHLRRAIKKEQENNGLNDGDLSKRTVTTAFVTELMDANRDAATYVPPDDMLSKQRTSISDADNDTIISVLPSESRVSNCFQPNIVPLAKLPLGANDELQALLDSPTGQNGYLGSDWTPAEREVVELLAQQQAVVKTIKNTEWASFLHRLQVPKEPKETRTNHPSEHEDIAPTEAFPFTSFVTSCSLLPPYGLKMRAFGSPSQFTSGVVFALPKKHILRATIQELYATEEEIAADMTKTWSWPAGYSAKTEFNIDGNGHLINGRDEARVPLSILRQYNVDYLTKEDHMISGRLVQGGLKVVPYNEIFVRVGGLGRIVDGKDVVTGGPCIDGSEKGRSFDKGLGLPVALFVRTATFGHLISLMRTRARLMHVLGENQVKTMPLLLISPDLGVRVLTESLQATLLKVASQELNPFQNPTIAHKTIVDRTEEEQLEQKLEELIDLDDSVRKLLTPEECVRLAGGFGATDDSVAAILKDAMRADVDFRRDSHVNNGVCTGKGHMLQDLVNEGLTAAVRSGDYYTSRQLLILYSLVASTGVDDNVGVDGDETRDVQGPSANGVILKNAAAGSELKENITALGTNLKPPPPPPLDTDRLRSATNSDGLLAVLGAAQVLKSMEDGGAMRRTDEVILALDE